MKRKILITLPLIILGILILTMGTVNATYKSNDPTVKSEETITITVTSTENLQNYDLVLKSHTGLTYVSCSASSDSAAVNSSSGRISYATLGSGTTTLGTYKFKAPKVTETTKYTVEFEVDGTTNRSTVTVNPITTDTTTNTQTGTTTEKPSASISSVVVNGITIKESLTVKNKDSVSVKVNVSNGESATIYNSLTKKTVTAKSGVATTVQVEEGTNTLTISLSNGTKTTRKIYSQKEEEVKPNVIEEEPVIKEEIKVILKTLSIQGVRINEEEEEEKIDFLLTPEFSSEIYEYTLSVPEYITKLVIEAVGDKEDFTIEITGNEELVDGKNIITILVKSKDEETTTKYTITANKEVVAIEANTEPIEEEPQDESNDWVKTIKLALTGGALAVALLGIIFAVVEYKYEKKDRVEKIENEFEPVSFENVDIKNDNDDAKSDIEAEQEENEKEEESIEIEQEETPKRKKGKHF